MCQITKDERKSAKWPLFPFKDCIQKKACIQKQTNIASRTSRPATNVPYHKYCRSVGTNLLGRWLAVLTLLATLLVGRRFVELPGEPLCVGKHLVLRALRALGATGLQVRNDFRCEGLDGFVVPEFEAYDDALMKMANLSMELSRERHGTVPWSEVTEIVLQVGILPLSHLCLLRIPIR